MTYFRMSFSMPCLIVFFKDSFFRYTDTHASQSRHTLFDNCNSINHQSSGGGQPALPHHLDGYTRWNNNVADNRTLELWTPDGYGFAVTQANLIGYKTLGVSLPCNAYFEGFGTRVSPDSLYEAQLQWRLGTLPVWIQASKDMHRGFVERIFSTRRRSTQPFAGIGYAIPNVDIYAGDTFTVDIYAEDTIDLAGWQFEIAFDPILLEAIEVSKGYFLEVRGGETFFQKGTINNRAGKIRGLSETGLNGKSVSGTGMLLSVTFSAKSGGKTQLTLNNFRLTDSSGQAIPTGPHEVALVVKGRLIWDMNGDQRVNVLDMILVARYFGKPASVNSRADVNSDGTINILDSSLWHNISVNQQRQPHLPLWQ